MATGMKVPIAPFVNEYFTAAITFRFDTLCATTIDGRNPAPPGMYKTLKSISKRIEFDTPALHINTTD